MPSRLSLCALAVIAALPLAACQPASLSDENPELGHPVGVEQRTLSASFALPADARPGPADLLRLRSLALEAQRRGAGPVSLLAYSRSGQDAGVRAYAERLAEGLRRQGAATVGVRAMASAGMTAAGAVEVRVPVWSAVAPTCGTYSRGMTPDFDNTPNSDWGCSIQRDRALMVQDPADLVRARTASGRDANRADDVLDKYGRGLATGSAPETMSPGTTSSVGSGGGSN
ncbi:pilus biogenesis CpaD protein (pilus_cpaD) [mine drainage metagenome]|uniref:Pilus biogenesis CpaD protein (Pilus_cpaD) n=1 Tax=mine drainage metagenome TaxID=410659 RepID=A0A1J5RQA5_9ZZZZ